MSSLITTWLCSKSLRLFSSFWWMPALAHFVAVSTCVSLLSISRFLYTGEALGEGVSTL